MRLIEDPTGLDPIENAILLALDRLGSRHDRPHRKNLDHIAEVHAAYGFAPVDVYARLVALSQPWMTSLRVVDFRGNKGSVWDGPAEPRYTMSRLTRLGELCVAALRGEVPGLPIGLILGDTYKGGVVPPADAGRVVDALRAVGRGATDDELDATVGPPSFPAGCSVEGDVDALQSGELVTLTLRGRVRVEGDHIHVGDLPPMSSPDLVVDQLTAVADDLGVTDVWDVSSRGHLDIQLRVLRPEHAPDVVAAVREVWSVRQTLECSYPAPLAQLLRRWLDAEPGRSAAADLSR